MNSKGQTLGIGLILMAFIGVVVGAILLQAAAQQVGTTTTLASLSNSQISAPANGETYTFTEYKLLDGVTITNVTGTAISSGNYSIANNQVVNGALAAVLTVSSAEYESVTWNVTATTAQPLTYVPDAGGRSIISLVIIFFALAIAVVALEPSLRSGVINMVSR